MSEWQKCPKCGSSDIHITWHDKGEWVKPCNARYYHTEELTAEILRHYCRGCGYEWNTPPTGKMRDELFGTLKDGGVAGVLKKYPAVKDALESARKEIARLTKITRIMAWEMAYNRSFDPPAIGKWADAHIESAGNISLDDPLYADMKSYVEQEATQ